MTEHVKVSITEGVMEITWARPEKKNALTQDMYLTAADALKQATADDSIRAVLLTSEGDSFCAGNDIADFAKANSGASGPRESSNFIRELAVFEKPLIAGVPGLAIGVGLTMLMHCDMVFVASDAKLSVPFVNLALCPEAASSITIPLRIGHARAFEMFALGEPVTGEEAARIGMANKALPASEVVEAARKTAHRVAKQPRGAIMVTKKLMRDAALYAQRTEEELQLFNQRLQTAEAGEAFAAFAQKRAPDFSKF